MTKRTKTGTTPRRSRRTESTSKPQSDPNIRALLRVLDEGFDTRAWHGPNLTGALRGVDAAEAAWRPAPDRHSIWELALHAAYWKWTARKRMGLASGRFARAGANFPALPQPADGEAWKRDLELLHAEHAALRAAVAGLAPAALGRRVGRDIWNVDQMIRGVAYHDLYHAGQIGLLKRLYRAETHE